MITSDLRRSTRISGPSWSGACGEMSEDCSCCVVWSGAEVEFFAGGEITGDEQELLSMMTAIIQSEFDVRFIKYDLTAE